MQKVKFGAAAAAGLMSFISIGGFSAYAETASAEENGGDIVILYTNDIHCAADSNIGYDGLALYKREMQAENNDVLVVDIGDALQGMPLGTVSKGEYLIRLMNGVGYDAAVPGNHDFDYGFDELLKREEELDCGYVCCNLFSLETGKKVFDPYKIVEAGGKRIAFVGATTPETFVKSTPKFFQNEDGEYIYDFSAENLYETIQDSVDNAKEDGADYVVLLAHLGETSVTKEWSALAVAENTVGIDVILDGHSHEVTPCLETENKNGETVMISQTGTKLANIGKLTISADGELKTEVISEIPAPDESLGLDEDSWTEAEGREGRYVDSEVNLLLMQIEAETDELLSEEIGTTDFKLYDCDPITEERRVRTGETNLGDLAADAYRYYLDTDAAIVNGGGLRASIDEGDITYREAVSVQPFNNMLCAAEIKGQYILDMLEHGARNYPEESGAFCHVSGIEYTIDAGIESSVEVDDKGCFVRVAGEYRVKNVYINGEPLDVEKTYTIASHDYYLKNGGDGNPMTGNCTVYRDNVLSDSDVLAVYIKENLGGSVPEEYSDPYGQGRIHIINASSASDENEESAEDKEIISEEDMQETESAPVFEETSDEDVHETETAPASDNTAQEPAADRDTRSPNTGTNSAGAAAAVLISAVILTASRKKTK